MSSCTVIRPNIVRFASCSYAFISFSSGLWNAQSPKLESPVLFLARYSSFLELRSGATSPHFFSTAPPALRVRTAAGMPRSVKNMVEKDFFIKVTVVLLEL